MSRVAGARLVVAGCCVAGLLALSSASMSCRAPRPPLSIEHEDPGIKIPAIKKAVREKDKSAVPKIVEQLDSDDPAVRFYAIQALEDLTGRTFDYQYYYDEEQRKPAVQKWRDWVAAGGK